jgi:hypothetical protein
MAAPMLLLTCAGVLVPALALAQDSSSQVLTLLRSNTPVGVAWGAFEAGRFQITEAVPALIAVLDGLPSGSGHERVYVAAAVLDALAQIHSVPGVAPAVAIPSAAVVPYLDRWPIRTLILLGRGGPERDQVVLDLFRSLPLTKGAAAETPGEMWFALANLLVPRSPSGFAASLLHGLRVELLVTVSESGGTSTELGSGISHTDGIGQKPPGFPPHAEYHWEWLPAGSSLLSTGPRSLYYSRRVTAEAQFPVSYTARLMPTGDDRVAYLSAIAGSEYRSDLGGRMVLGVRWTNGGGYRADVRKKRRAIEREYAGLLARLVSRGRLNADEAARLPLSLTTVVRDERGDRSRPLPQIPPD